MCRLMDKWRIALIHHDYEPLQEREVLVLIVSARLQRGQVDGKIQIQRQR